MCFLYIYFYNYVHSFAFINTVLLFFLRNVYCVTQIFPEGFHLLCRFTWLKKKIHYFKWELCLKIFLSCMFLCTRIIILCKEYVTFFLCFSECFCRAEKPWSYLLRKYSSTGYLQAFIHVYDLKFHYIDDDDDDS